MKKITLYSVILFVLSSFISSCVGYSTQIHSIPIGNFSTIKSNFPKKGWEDIEIYYYYPPTDSLDRIAKIVVIGNKSISERRMRMKMRREAGKYEADAIIDVKKMPIQRSNFNGVAAGLNMISIFSDSNDNDCDDDDTYLDTGGDYDTFQLEGVAVVYKTKK